uniref:Transmembrane protein n=1 Tax=Mesocestoides corti TaxID=53468 RepID=A0A5K3F3Z5_MESCO
MQGRYAANQKKTRMRITIYNMQRSQLNGLGWVGVTCGSGMWLVNKACSVAPVFFLLGLWYSTQFSIFLYLDDCQKRN